MARRRGNRYGGGGPRRNWSKIAFYAFGIVISLVMVLSLLAPLLYG
ncbi:MAG: hypothetical protein M3220_01060 [Chloroflexota bacterium]|nr:hypothetical protein [Chloroflexota bacterium]